MSVQEADAYKKRILDLEQEVRDREGDLERFRHELNKANSKLEVLIQQISQELKIAHAIQKVLVPTEIPHIPGFDFSTKYVPSAMRGGDYFDIFEHEDRFRFGLIIASSSGFAMSALLLSVLLKLTRQMEARKGAEPHKVVKQIIQDMEPNMEDGDTAEIFYGLFDRRSYELHYCRVGGLTALIQDFTTGELQPLESVSGPIQKGHVTPLKSRTLALNPRDRLILCSRGIVEARNAGGEEFGQERLLQAILESPRQGTHELRNQILFHVDRFTAGGEPEGDRTVVVAEVKDRVIKLAKT